MQFIFVLLIWGFATQRLHLTLSKIKLTEIDRCWKIYNYQLARPRRVVKIEFCHSCSEMENIPILTPFGTWACWTNVVKATCGLHNYLTQGKDNIFQAMLDNGLEVKADGLQDLANIWGYHAAHAPTEVRSYFKDYCNKEKWSSTYMILINLICSMCFL